MDELMYYLVTPVNLASITDYLEYMSIDIYDWTLVFALLFLIVELTDDALTRRFSGERFFETLSSL